MKTTRAIVHPTERFCRGSARGLAFTLIELILVMALLLIMLSMTGPSLSRFFRGRRLDSEAQRLLALTRYGQNRAVAEGLPMTLWLDSDISTYRLQIDPTYSVQDTNAMEFVWNEEIEIEVVAAEFATNASPARLTGVTQDRRPTLRFLADGSIDDNSPSQLRLRELRDKTERRTKDQDEVWIMQSRSRLRYEISTNPPTSFRR